MSQIRSILTHLIVGFDGVNDDDYPTKERLFSLAYMQATGCSISDDKEEVDIFNVPTGTDYGSSAEKTRITCFVNTYEDRREKWLNMKPKVMDAIDMMRKNGVLTAADLTSKFGFSPDVASKIRKVKYFEENIKQEQWIEHVEIAIRTGRMKQDMYNYLHFATVKQILYEGKMVKRLGR